MLLTLQSQVENPGLGVQDPANLQGLWLATSSHPFAFKCFLGAQFAQLVLSASHFITGAPSEDRHPQPRSVFRSS